MKILGKIQVYKVQKMMVMKLIKKHNQILEEGLKEIFGNILMKLIMDKEDIREQFVIFVIYHDLEK